MNVKLDVQSISFIGTDGQPYTLNAGEFEIADVEPTVGTFEIVEVGEGFADLLRDLGFVVGES